MAYLAPIHQPSSVRHALKLNFLSPTEECLVVAKANRLELYTRSNDGLTLRHSKALYGRVTMLDKLRPASSKTDHLFVGTDRFLYFTLSWDAETKQLRTENSYVDQADKSARDSQTGDRCHIDPTGRFMTLELYEGVVTVIPITTKRKKTTDPEIGTLGEPLLSRIPELFVRSSAFFQGKLREKAEKPKFALLYEDTQKKVRLRVRELSYAPGLGSGDGGSADFEDAEGPHEELELGASHLIPVSGPAYGLIILGETSIMYYEQSTNNKIRIPLEAATLFIAWEQIDQLRFVLADEYGKLYLLMLELDALNTVQGWQLDVIGETSRASVLVYLDAGDVFVGSHQGDSQVIHINPKAMEVVQTFPNIAPILDFTVMDMGSAAGEGQTNEFSSGQARLVTGSGAFKDGSLRSVRSGVGLEDLGLLDRMENITDLFSLQISSTAVDDVLVVSFVDETRTFHFSRDGEVEELSDIKGIDLGQGTILATNLSGRRLVQVTNSVVRLSDVESGIQISEWRPAANGSITAAAANLDSILVSIGGSVLVNINTDNDLSVRATRIFDAESQLACLAVSPHSSTFCIVGFWEGSTVSVLNMDTLQTVHIERIADEGASVPRCLLLANLLEAQPSSLFVAMADGTVFTFSMDSKNGSLSGKQSIVLGTQQANLRALPRGNGLYNVFATCDHPSLIYGSEGRIVYSAVTAEKASCVCSFNGECYPGAVAIATMQDLKIALVDEERSTHVEGLHVGETVRRIAYSSELKAFGLGTIKRTLQEGVEVVQSHFKLADEVMFKVLATYNLNEDELVESVIRADLDDGSAGLAERFVVGTAYLVGDHSDTVRGRILVFEVTEDSKLKLVTELAVKGACRCLGMVDGKIVAALIKTVVVYSFEYETPSHPFLVKKASYRTSTAPIDLAINNNIIAIADLMKSVSIVEYKKGTAGMADSLIEIARHFQTSWSTAVAQVNDHSFLESDAEGNLLVLEHNINGVTADDRRRLQPTSEMCLGEMVNRIRRITVPNNVDAVIIPRAFLATVEGAIYLFGLIAPDKQDLLMRLQANMAVLVQSLGHVPFNKYRAFKNQIRESEEPYRFVDGELIERFLECDLESQEQIVKGLKVDVTEVKAIVESLRRLR